MMDVISDSCDYNTGPPYCYEQVVKTPLRCCVSPEQVKKEALLAMDELTGWCTKAKATILMDLVLNSRAKTVVEIGVWGGRSLVPMAFVMRAQGRGVVIGVDPWDSSASAIGMDGVNRDWWSSVDHEAIYQGLVHKIHKFDLEDFVALRRATSKNAQPVQDIDILHIDGNHAEETSFGDVIKWAPLVRVGGFIVFDDITWGTTSKAVEWLNNNYTKVAQYHEDCDWAIWVKS